MGYGGRDGGSEWMGVPPDRFKKKKRISGNAVKGGFKLPKSKGANSAETRFGIEKDDKYLLHRRPAKINKPAKRQPVGGSGSSPAKAIRPYRPDKSKPKARPLGPNKKGSDDNMKKLMPLRPKQKGIKPARRPMIGLRDMGGRGVIRKGR